MSTEERAIAATTHSSQPIPGKPRPPLRLWLPSLVIGAYWFATTLVVYGEFAAFTRFVTRALGSLLLLLFLIGWWLANRHFRWRDRLSVLGGIGAMMAVTLLVADRTIDIFGLLMTGIPIAAALGACWLWLVRSRSEALQRNGYLLAALLVFASLSLLRWEGLDGRQRNVFAWRWSPTAEERFLQERDLPTTPAPAADWHAQPGDWLSFRGGAAENVIRELELEDWDANPPQSLWRQRVGPGWSSMIVVDGHLVTQEQRGDIEAIVCYDAATGTEQWAHEDITRFDESLSGVGPRGTPTFADGKIYTLGARGQLNCLEARTGVTLWSKDLVRDFGAQVPQWGLSVSPMVIDDLVVAFAGGSDGRAVVALERETGETVWTAAGGTQSYASPQVMTIHGVRQIVISDDEGLYGLRIQDGKRLWKRPNTNKTAIPMLQPHLLLPHNDLVVAWDVGVARLSLERPAAGNDDWTLTEKWYTTQLKPSFNDFVIHEGYIYGLDDGILCCVDLETGKRTWKKGRYGFGQLLLLPDSDALLVLTEKGEVVRVATSPDRHEERGRFSAITGKTWNHPIIAHGKLYARNNEEMACYQLK